MLAATAFRRALCALVVVGAGCAQMSSEPSFEQVAGISSNDPTLPASLRDELRRLDIVNRLDFLDHHKLLPRFCLLPLPTDARDIDPHRSLFVHDRDTLAAGNFSLRRTLNQIATQVAPDVPGTSAMSIFRQFWDTQNPAASGVTTGPHCTDSAQTVNGFPNACRPAPEEGREALGTDASVDERIDHYHAIALVNRLDLAHEGWRNCGEFRIIYTTEIVAINARNLVIFEAVLPNPTPGCRSGCRPVAQMWKSLSAMSSPADRAAALEQFFYTGLPGFRPVVHVDHYSAKGVTGSYGSSGSGQIRSNQFINGVSGTESRWMLKEFKTVLDCGATPCRFDIVPIGVKVNPWGELWNEDLANNPADPLSTLAQAFQVNTVAEAGHLGNTQLTGFGYSVALPHNAAQSFSTLLDPSIPPNPVQADNYLTAFGSASGATTVFRNDVAAAATGFGLSTNALVNRALAQSCAGCHNPSGFGLLTAGSIGPSLAPSGAVVSSWPDAARVHVENGGGTLSELSGPAYPTHIGHALSPALRDVFLPDRLNFLLSQLNASICPSPNRFKHFSPQPEGIKLQDRLLADFAPEAQRLRREAAERVKRGGPIPLAESLAFDRRVAASIGGVEQSLAASRKQLGLPSHQVGLKPQALVLDAAKRAGNDAALERALRQKEIDALIAQEPPRRTVRGSFSVH
jgi:hypothetical protein